MIIKTQDGILPPEIAQKMQQDLQECKEETATEKLLEFDRYFDE